ncbi:OIT3-like protein [Mya arenaria]|uniref:OIT3-like protein n=1 Tax=Mya arenaria TaxID=6604 RepID=A0ABY7EIU8_MYAAR|nr:OIT3-like protein [Mya arenaria]
MERRLYETELFCGLLVLLVNVVQVVGFDPCIPGSHKEFPDVNFGDRNENCIHEAGSECDYYLPAKWYSSKLGDLATECPQTGTCGVIYPAWINGSFPTEEEDIVNLTICIKFKNDCCHDNSLTAQVKNCNATATAVIHEAVQTYIAVLVTVLVVIKAVVFLRSKCGKRITKKAVPYECLPARPETGEYNLIGRIRESTPARASYLTPTMDMRSSNTQADAAC